MSKYIALLRGINVGGNSPVAMPDLRACFESLGFVNVSTYINSGNVIFETKKTDQNELQVVITKKLEQTFDCKPPVLVLSDVQLRAIVEKAPKGFGQEPALYRCDVLFVMPPLTANEAISGMETKEGVDQAAVGPGVVYFSRLVAKITQSRLSRIVGTPIYRRMTIRNWNTTSKLMALLDKE